MAVSQAFRNQRVALTLGVLTPLVPPIRARAVSIGNATTDDLEVHTNDDLSEYLIVAAGYERLIDLSQANLLTFQTTCWLKAHASGTVVVVWYASLLP